MAANLVLDGRNLDRPCQGCQFLQTDPIGSKDDLDLYAYVGDDPIDKTDPTGNDGLTFSVEGFIGEKGGGDFKNGGYGAAGVSIGFDKQGNLEIAAFTSSGDIKPGEGGGIGGSAGLGFYHGDAKDMERTTDTAGGMVGPAGASTSYMGDKNGIPTGKGPFSGAIPVVGKTLAKTVGKASVGLGLGGYHTKTTTHVAVDTIKSSTPQTHQQVCSSTGGRSRPKDCG